MTSEQTVRTVGEAFRRASSFLQAELASLQRLPESERQAAARHEAEVLLCCRLRLSRTMLLTRLHDPIEEADWARIAHDLDLRRQGMPLQYITGEAPFYGRIFHVRPGCLIPRPETEVLVEEAATWLQRAGLAQPTVLDVGTGSGAIAVTLALEEARSLVHAVDVEPAALAIAHDNAERLGANVILHEGDAFVFMASPERPAVNLLVSNPPYIPSYEISALDAEVRMHEPITALDGGEDGLNFYRRLADEAHAWFAPGAAAILLEVGAGQAPDVAALFERSECWQAFSFRIIPDLRGIGRVVFGSRD